MSRARLIPIHVAAILAVLCSVCTACRRSVWRDAAALIAVASAKHRDLAIRIPGARHAELAAVRGEAWSVPGAPELAEAEALLLRSRGGGSDEARRLGLHSRVHLLRKRWNEAVSTARMAAETDPNAAVDLANAYLARAMAGSATRDLQFAIEYYGRALVAAPGDTTALFNRGLALESLFLYLRAQEDFEAVAASDRDSGWAAEAGAHAARIRAEIQQWRRDLPALGGEELSAGVPAEAALESGLGPRLQALSSPDAGRSAKARAELSLAAAELSKQHRDDWLLELLAGNASQKTGIAALATAIEAGNLARRSAALEASLKARRAFEASGSMAGASRAQLESVYALSRSFRPADCLREAESLTARLAGRRYRWIAGQLAIEHAICEFHAGRFESAMRRIAAAAKAVSASRLETLHLRARAAEASFHRILGNGETAVRTCREGLQRFWQRPFPPARAYHFLGELFLNAEREEAWHAAQTIAREAVEIVRLGPNRLTEAAARSRLASISLRSGDVRQAIAEGETAERLFASFADDPASREFAVTNAIALAEAHLAAGAHAEARRVLREYEDAAGQTVYTRLGLHRALGLTWARSGESERALASLRAAALEAARSSRDLKSGAARLRWKKEAGPAFRTLARLLLERGDTEAALAAWEWFRSAPVGSGVVPLDEAVKSMQSALWRFRDATVVSWMEVDDRLGIWLYDDRGVRFSWAPAPAEHCRRTAARFARLCSQRSSDLASIRSAGAELHRILLGPVEHLLETRRTLVFEPDTTPGAIAFEALVRPDGHWLAEKFTIAVGPGLWADLALRTRRIPVTDAMPALIVGNPVTAAEGSAPPLPDAEREARLISGMLSSSKLLTREDATAGSVQLGLTDAMIFHFAGHARFDGETARLLLSDRHGCLDADVVERLATRCRLATLSACSTGAAEVRGPWSVESLVQAFWRAGTPEVIASRWDVDSGASARLFEKFYDDVLNGKTAATALRSAAESVRLTPETAHPYFWSAFGLFGGVL
jgi:CHAT domain-containing protein